MSRSANTALVLTGGGARAAYQVGLLRCLARMLPESEIPIITGTSAGAINAVFLAAHRGPLDNAAEELSELWTKLTVDRVFKVGSGSLWANVFRWGKLLISGRSPSPGGPRALPDTSPLADYLRQTLRSVDDEIPGLADNVEQGRLQALALTTLRYATQQTVTWVQGSQLETWQRPTRLGIESRISIRHVMASAALPLAFPAIKIGESWYGDGGIRMLNPLGPAVHLGADRIIAISTRYRRSLAEASQPVISGYPPVAQVAGSLMNAVFLDALDHDAEHLERVNRLLAGAPQPDARGLRHIELLVLRPSQDLGRLAAEFEPRLPGAFRFLTRSLGTRGTKSPDFLSLLMFQPDYLQRLIEIGERDAEAQSENLRRMFGA
jgi:NTE family protein